MNCTIKQPKSIKEPLEIVVSLTAEEAAEIADRLFTFETMPDSDGATSPVTENLRIKLDHVLGNPERGYR